MKQGRRGSSGVYSLRLLVNQTVKAVEGGGHDTIAADGRYMFRGQDSAVLVRGICCGI